MTNQHTILAVLDWGLGHASRCIPLVRQLLMEGDRVTLASSGYALKLLRTAFPEMSYLELPTYGIRYPTKNMVWNLGWQAPGVIRTVLQENKVLDHYLNQQAADRIISDGRFGCYHKSCESIWMAHQLHIQFPNRLLAKALNGSYHRYIRQRFDAVWVPDWKDERRIAGDLSQAIPQLPHRYLGALSRFGPEKEGRPIKYDYLALLSGPEPQRAYLESEIRTAFEKTDQACLIIKGVPGSTTIRKYNHHIAEVDWLYGDALQEVVMSSAQIICRSGYSTLMDLHYWQKPALLIPTPGQTEQEYLAKYWAEKGWAHWQSQGQLKLNP
jgi:predicted glycosyltransferase